MSRLFAPPPKKNNQKKTLNVSQTKMASASIKNRGGLHFLSCGLLLSVSQQQENCLPNPTAEFLLCSRAFRAPPGVRRRRWSTIVVPVCEVFLWRRCGARSLTLPQWLRRRLELLKDKVWSSALVGTPLLCLSMCSELKDAFLSHDSEDKGHWVTSKLTPDPCWFRGLFCVCTHTHTHIHKDSKDLPEKRPPPTQPIPSYLLRHVSSNLVKTIGLPLLLRLGISRESWVWWLCHIPPCCCKNI